MTEWFNIAISPQLCPRWPDYIKAHMEDNTRVYVQLRTCTPHGEWEPVSQTEDVRRMYCVCGHELGMDWRTDMPYSVTRLFAMPKYCPECGRKLVSKGRMVDE